MAADKRIVAIESAKLAEEIVAAEKELRPTSTEPLANRWDNFTLNFHMGGSLGAMTGVMVAGPFVLWRTRRYHVMRGMAIPLVLAYAGTYTVRARAACLVVSRAHQHLRAQLMGQTAGALLSPLLPCRSESEMALIKKRLHVRELGAASVATAALCAIPRIPGVPRVRAAMAGFTMSYVVWAFMAAELYKALPKAVWKSLTV